MQVMSLPTKSRLLLQAVAQWWRNWTGGGSSLSRLENCGDEVERIARDLAMPVSELRTLASAGPEGADLLWRRMAALDPPPWTRALARGLLRSPLSAPSGFLVPALPRLKITCS